VYEQWIDAIARIIGVSSEKVKSMPNIDEIFEEEPDPSTAAERVQHEIQLLQDVHNSPQHHDGCSTSPCSCGLSDVTDELHDKLAESGYETEKRNLNDADFLKLMRAKLSEELELFEKRTALRSASKLIKVIFDRFSGV